MQKHTRNECKRGETTLETSVKDCFQTLPIIFQIFIKTEIGLENKVFIINTLETSGKDSTYTRNEWKRSKIPAETSVED